jgi:cytochrome c peroxidase
MMRVVFSPDKSERFSERHIRFDGSNGSAATRGYQVSATFLTIPLLFLLAYNSVLLAASVGTEDIGAIGPPPAPAPGQAPPVPEQGPLAEPRSSDQAGFPAALSASVIPPASPLTPAAVALGETLFFDSRLSGDRTVACATCHDPSRAFTDGRVVSVGIHGRVGQRNAPTILNALYNKTQFWDGRVSTLEQQAALPITNPFEMGAASIGDAVSKIAGDKDYQTQFMQAFGRGVNEQDMLRALAAYVGRWFRSILPSTISSPETQTLSATRPNGVGNSLIARPAATSAMLCRTNSGM